MLFAEIATWFIIFTTGSVLYTHGIRYITTADQAAAALEPLVQTLPHAGVLVANNRAIMRTHTRGRLANSWACSQSWRWVPRRLPRRTCLSRDE